MLLSVESLTITHTSAHTAGEGLSAKKSLGITSGAKTDLVHDLSFSIDSGETLAIVGESGSGKSVTSLAIMGLLPDELRASSGRILFESTDLLTLDEADIRRKRGRDISMVFQEPMTSLNPVRTIGAQIIEGIRENLGLSRSAAKSRAIDLLQDVGIADADNRLRQYPHNFSGGMRQRVMIAIALSANPRLIIADEPTTALDVTIQAQVLDLMSQLCKQHNVALILITHNLGLVARYADRVSVMYAGSLVEIASTSKLYSAPKHPYTEGLLLSVPRLKQARDKPLLPINGTPADPFSIIPGCRFHPRCKYVKDKCRTQAPLFDADTACHYPLNTQSKVC